MTVTVHMLTVLQVLLVRWLLIVSDHLEGVTLEKLCSLYQLLFLQLDHTLLVHCFLVILCN